MASIDIPNLGTVTVNDLATEETADNILKTQRQIQQFILFIYNKDFLFL